MTTTFLLDFSRALIPRLVAEGHLEIAPGQQARVALYLGNYLHTHARGGSLLSSVEAALLRCPEVLELYIGIEDLKHVVEDMR